MEALFAAGIPIFAEVLGLVLVLLALGVIWASRREQKRKERLRDLARRIRIPD